VPTRPSLPAVTIPAPKPTPPRLPTVDAEQTLKDLLDFLLK
jgi:hypothetical protein